MRPTPTSTWITPVTVFGIGAMFALMAVRAWYAVSFAEPLLSVTSGAEEESTFALWKFAHGQTVYGDPYLPPYAASYYNWLFYVTYGVPVVLLQKLFGLGDIWIPTVARLVSVVVAFIGARLAHQAFLPSVAELGETARRQAAALACFLFFGPLVGFWALSVNPELAATACGLASWMALAAGYRTRRVSAILSAVVLSYLAWSFKQSHVFAAGMIGLFLLLRRDWTGLLLAIIAHLILVGATLGLGSDVYRRMILYHLPLASTLFGYEVSGIVLDRATLIRNLINLAIKAGPLAAFVAVPALFFGTRERWARLIADDRLALSLCGLIASAVLALPASAKIGAAENYYFPLVLFMALSIVAAWPFLALRPGAHRTFLFALGAGWALLGIACLSVLSGKFGVLSVRPWHDKVTAQAKCIDGTPGPRFIFLQHLAVPWINPSGPYFMYAYNYTADRGAGYPFPDGTIGDRIAAGYFATLIVPDGMKPSFDGATFDRYRRSGPPCEGLAIYIRDAIDGRPR